MSVLCSPTCARGYIFRCQHPGCSKKTTKGHDYSECQDPHRYDCPHHSNQESARILSAFLEEHPVAAECSMARQKMIASTVKRRISGHPEKESRELHVKYIDLKKRSHLVHAMYAFHDAEGDYIKAYEKAEERYMYASPETISELCSREALALENAQKKYTDALAQDPFIPNPGN